MVGVHYIGMLIIRPNKKRPVAQPLKTGSTVYIQRPKDTNRRFGRITCPPNQGTGERRYFTGETRYLLVPGRLCLNTKRNILISRLTFPFSITL